MIPLRTRSSRLTKTSAFRVKKPSLILPQLYDNPSACNIKNPLSNFLRLATSHYVLLIGLLLFALLPFLERLFLVAIIVFSIHFSRRCTLCCGDDYSASSYCIPPITQWRLFPEQCHATGTSYAAGSRHLTERCHAIPPRKGSARAISNQDLPVDFRKRHFRLSRDYRFYFCRRPMFTIPSRSPSRCRKREASFLDLLEVPLTHGCGWSFDIYTRYFCHRIGHVKTPPQLRTAYKAQPKFLQKAKQHKLPIQLERSFGNLAHLDSHPSKQLSRTATILKKSINSNNVWDVCQ